MSEEGGRCKEKKRLKINRKGGEESLMERGEVRDDGSEYPRVPESLK